MKSSRKPSFRGWRKLPFCVLAIAVLSVCIPASIPVARAATAQCQVDHTAGFLHSFHSELADASGCKVRLKGVNWFGFETRTFSPHGLWARNWQDMLGQITQAGFNTIRLPFSNQLFDPSSKPQGIDYKLNPDLKGLSGLALMDRIIQGAGSQGLRVILDRHDTSADIRPVLWYTDQVPQARWLQDWVKLAERYRGNTTVIGADLASESTARQPGAMAIPARTGGLAARGAGKPSPRTKPHWSLTSQRTREITST